MPNASWDSLSREDFEQALNEMGHVVDVNVSDLMTITEKARKHAALRHKETMAVRDLMTHPVHSVAPDTTLGDAADRMVSHRISGMPVVDAAGRLAGIVTEADFLRAIGVPSRQPTQSLWHRLEDMFSARGSEIHEPSEKVGAIMARDVVTVTPGQSLHDALAVLKTHQVKRLVVIDDQGRPVGIITRSDLVRAFFRKVQWGADELYISPLESDPGGEL